jgi:hypothetical protein
MDQTALERRNQKQSDARQADRPVPAIYLSSVMGGSEWNRAFWQSDDKDMSDLKLSPM